MIEEAHADRLHSHWSASSTARNWTCAGALAMATLADAEVESIHAARGTAAHTISEACLRDPAKEPEDFEDAIVKTKGHKIQIDGELIASAEMYVDYVRGLNADDLWIEKKFSLAALDPPFEAGGTVDAAAIFYHLRLIEIIDLKNGMDVVEVNGNKQARTYALTALLNLDPALASNIDWIKVTIVQPRASHEDGRIRSETFHVADLLDWAYELLQAMNRAKVAWDAFHTLNGTRPEFLAWADHFLTPGNCTFCPAEGICPTLKKQALSVIPQSAAEWFEDPDAPLPDLTIPPTLTDAELEYLLNGLDMLEAWAKAVRSLAHSRAERGAQFNDWMLVEKIGRRAYVDKAAPDLADKIRAAVLEVDPALELTADQILSEPKPRSLAQLENIPGVGPKVKKALQKLEGKLWHKPITGTNLVQKDKTERPAVGSIAQRNFETPEATG